MATKSNFKGNKQMTNTNPIITEENVQTTTELSVGTEINVTAVDASVSAQAEITLATTPTINATTAPEDAVITETANTTLPRSIVDFPLISETVTQPVVVDQVVNTQPTVVLAPVMVNSGVALTTDAEILIQRIKDGGDRRSIDVINMVLEYMKVMSPNKIVNEDTGARAQVNLFRAIQLGVNQDTKDFKLLWNTLLRLVADNLDGLFHKRYINRYVTSMHATTSDVEGFVRLLNLMTTTSVASGRAESLKQIDFNKSLQYGLTDTGRQRLLAFYNK